MGNKLGQNTKAGYSRLVKRWILIYRLALPACAAGLRCSLDRFLGDQPGTQPRIWAVHEYTHPLFEARTAFPPPFSSGSSGRVARHTHHLQAKPDCYMCVASGAGCATHGNRSHPPRTHRPPSQIRSGLSWLGRWLRVGSSRAMTSGLISSRAAGSALVVRPEAPPMSRRGSTRRITWHTPFSRRVIIGPGVD